MSSPWFRIGFALLFGLSAALGDEWSWPRRDTPPSLRSFLGVPLMAALCLLMPVVFTPTSLLEPDYAAPTYLTLFHGLTSIFGSILLYDGLLLLLLPWLRRRLRASSLAILWMLPSAMPSLFSFVCNSFSPFKPIVFLRIDQGLFLTLFWIWLGGFLLALGWQILAHLRFRRQILRDCVAADGIALDVLRSVRRELDAKDRGQLVYSRGITAPLTIGIFKRTLRIVLPLRNDYSREDLRLIFRHELIHIQSGHNQLKFVMAFVTAFGWFLPTQWLGLRRAAEDMELECDEAAVKPLSEAETRQYAGLILDNAGTSRGFTTCLSASARGLRYRLKRLLHPRKQKSGGWICGILLTLFFLSLGLVGAAPGGATLPEAIRQSPEEAVQVAYMDYDCLSVTEQGRYRNVDTAGLLAALEDVRLYRAPAFNRRKFERLPNLEIFLESGRILIIYWDGKGRQCYIDDTYSVYLTDRVIDLNALIRYGEKEQ